LQYRSSLTEENISISIGDALLKLGVDTTGFDKGLQGVGASLKKHQKAIGMGMVAMGGTIMGGFAVATKAAADFDSAMREVNTMLGLSEVDFEALSGDVLQLSTDLGVDAVDSANALYQAISAGIPKENAIEFLQIATKSAIGGITDTKTAVDGLTTVMNAFKIPLSDTQRVADIMFTTVKNGKTTMEELSSSLFNVAPIAAASGVGFDEVSAALATMTKQGVPTAQATTQLRQMMISLQKPSALMSDVIKGLGYESGQAMLNELGLADSMNLLRDASSGSNDMLMEMFGSVEAGSAVLSLTGDNATMFKEDLEAMTEAEGAANDAFLIMEDSASRQATSLKESFDSVAISIGNVLLPVLSDIIDTLKPIIDSIRTWTAENPGLTKVIAIGSIAFGALLIVLGGLMLLMPGLTSLTAAFGFTLSAAIWPITAVALAIAALIAIGVLLWKNWDKILAWCKEIWGKILDFFKSTFEKVKEFFINIWNKIVDIFKQHWDKILAILFPAVGIPILIARNWDKILEVTKKIWGKIIDWIKDKWNSMIDWFKSVPEKIGAIFAKVKDFILAPFRAAWKGIEEGINWLIRTLNGISFKLPDFLGGKQFGINIPEVSLPTFGKGGIIPEPTLLYGLRSKNPYAIAGESGMERVTPMGEGYQTANITFQVDGRTLAKVLGAPLVDEIRVRTGMQI